MGARVVSSRQWDPHCTRGGSSDRGGRTRPLGPWLSWLQDAPAHWQPTRVRTNDSPGKDAAPLHNE